jgi:hypothetical protein
MRDERMRQQTQQERTSYTGTFGGTEDVNEGDDDDGGMTCDE